MGIVVAVAAALIMRQGMALKATEAALRETQDTQRYLAEQGAALHANSDALSQELRQFKEGGFDRLVREKLTAIQDKSTSEIDSREREIKKQQVTLVEQQRRATEAFQAFQQNIGSIAEQIKSLGELQDKVGELNDLLKPQQLRGELGEVILRSLISDKLPRSQYEEEYTFADGKKVEFAIRLNEKLVPVDSKLQLEDFKRMREATDDKTRQTCRTEFKRKVKQKIDEVKQYIRPEEGTHNFALMVIPSEAVYYDIIGHKDFLDESGLYDYARYQNVFLTSPLTFWVYLVAIAQGLRGMEIGRRAEEILAGLQNIAGKIKNFSQGEFQVLGTHLRNASKQYDEAVRRIQDVQEGLSALERLEAQTLTDVSMKELPHTRSEARP